MALRVMAGVGGGRDTGGKVDRGVWPPVYKGLCHTDKMNTELSIGLT